MKPMAECFQLVRKWFKNPLIRNTIILSCLFALIIHILFSITAPCDFLEGEWGAGDILTYVSTIALGILAVWQNQKFKEDADKAAEEQEKRNFEAQSQLKQENKEAQQKLQAIINQSNEISMITRIVDQEVQYIDQLEKATLDYLNACDTKKVADAFRARFNHNTEKQEQLNNRIRESKLQLEFVIKNGYCLSLGEEKAIIKSINYFENQTLLTITKRDPEFLQHLSNFFIYRNSTEHDAIETIAYNSAKSIILQIVGNHTQSHSKLKQQLTDYISTRKRVLNRILLHKMSLDEIRNIYTVEV